VIKGVSNELGAETENGVPASEVPGVGEQDWLLDAKVDGYAARLHGPADKPQLEHYWPSAHGLDDASLFEQEWLVIHPEMELEGAGVEDGVPEAD